MCDLHFETLKGICCKEISITLPKTIRRSYLDMYSECPYALGQTLKHNIISDGNVWSVVGNILHDIFEENSMLDVSQSDELMFDKFMAKFNEYKEENQHAFDHAEGMTKYNVTERMIEKARNSIKTYLKYEETALKPTYVESEIKLTTKDGLPDITMTLDRVAITPSFSEIVDYKTGKTYSGKDIVEGFQVATYILGFKEAYGFFPNRFVLLFLDEDKQRVINYVDDNTYVCEIRGKAYTLTLSDKYDMIEDLLSSAKDGKWGVGSSVNSFKCDNFCGVKQKGYCIGSEQKYY